MSFQPPAQPNVKAGSRVDREQPAEHLASRAVRKAKAEGKMEGRAEAAVRIEKAIYDGSNVQALIDELCGWTRMAATDVA